MAKVRLEQAGENWAVTIVQGGENAARAVWDDLDFAAYSAISFAGTVGAGTPELGVGVPADALALGENLRKVFEAARVY